MATPPQLTPEQRTAALAKAAEARAARAEIKARLKMGSLSLRDALDSDDPNVGKLKVVSLLESLPGVGKVKARRVMTEIGIADNRRVQGLGAQQRAVPARPARLATRLIIVVSGPGGVGKGTIVDALVARDPHLWLSRSWTTRAQRPGERDDAYVFTSTELRAPHRRRRLPRVDRVPRQLLRHARARAARRPGAPDIVLEIELDGAQQVKAQYPEAVLIFVLPAVARGAGTPPARPGRPRRQGARPAPQGRDGRAGRPRPGRPRRGQRRSRPHGRRDAGHHRRRERTAAGRG